MLDTCGVERAVVVGVSMGVPYSLRLASIRADLVAGLVLVAAALPLAVHPERADIAARIGGPAPESPEGWDRYNIAYWHAHYDDFVDWFFHQVFPEPHSTKAHEDATGWARETEPTILEADELAPPCGVDTRDLLAAVSCPTLWMHGDDDRLLPHAVAVEGAAATDSPLVTFAGGGHLPNVRDPVRFNLLLRDFVERSVS